MTDAIRHFIDPRTEQAWNVRLVRTGDAYGLDDCLVNSGTDLVEFYDADQDPEKFGPRGQFVSRYFRGTIEQHSTGLGLALDCGIPRWTLSPEGFDVALQNLADLTAA